MQTRMKIAWRAESRAVKGEGGFSFSFFSLKDVFRSGRDFLKSQSPHGHPAFCVLCVSMSYLKNVSLQ